METSNDLTFELSDKVTREKVSYKNRYGIAVAADMYLPKGFDKTKKHPAILVGTPYVADAALGDELFAYGSNAATECLDGLLCGEVVAPVGC